MFNFRSAKSKWREKALMNFIWQRANTHTRIFIDSIRVTENTFFICFVIIFLCNFHFQIDVFRSIRDDEGNQLTHNFRPIQPLGDRVVIYVPPSSETNMPNSNLDGLYPAMIEPPQTIDLNSPVNHDKFQGEPDDGTPDGVDEDIRKIEQDLNAVDTDTPSHPKNTKKHKNNGSINSLSSVALIMSAFLWMSLNCPR